MKTKAMRRVLWLSAVCATTSLVGKMATAVAGVQYTSTSATVYGGEYQGYIGQNEQFTYFGFINQSGTSIVGGLSSGTVALLGGGTGTNTIGPYSFTADATGINASGSAQGFMFASTDGSSPYAESEDEVNYDVHFIVDASITAIVSGDYSALYANGTLLNTSPTQNEFALRSGIDYEYEMGTGGEFEGQSNGITLSGQLLFGAGALNWQQPVPGLWSTASNWTTSTVPNSSLDANFTTGSATAYTVTLTDASSCNNLNVQGDAVTLDTAGKTLSAGGALTIGPGNGNTSASLTVLADAKGNGTINVAGAVSVLPGGTLAGNATIIANVANAGTVAPGTSIPGALQIGGNYNQTPSGNLNIRINGSATVPPNTPSNFDSLAVSGGSVSLAGNLNVTTPAISVANDRVSPPTSIYNNSYQVVSTVGGAISGTFANSPKALQTTYQTTNGSTGQVSGVFDVSYAQNAVTLSNFHQVYLLSYGVNFSNQIVNGVSTQNVQGGTDAANVTAAANKNIAGLITQDDVGQSETSSGAGNKTDLENDISTTGSYVHPGDLAIIFISSHGDWNPFDVGPSIPRQVGGNYSNPVYNSNAAGPSDIYLTNEPNDFGDRVIDAPTLLQQFSGSEWVGVNKLFIITSCYSGGLWNSSSGAQYLSSLDHAAIIAGSTENNFGYADGSTGQTFLALALEQGLANLQGQDINFANLMSQIHSSVQFYTNTSNIAADEGNPWDVGPMTGGDGIVSYATPDFNLDLSGTGSVPEPANVGSALFGVSLLFLRRFRKGSAV